MGHLVLEALPSVTVAAGLKKAKTKGHEAAVVQASWNILSVCTKKARNNGQIIG